MSVKGFSSADVLPIAISVGFLLALSAAFIANPLVTRWVAWDGGFLLYGPFVWTVVAGSILVTYVHDRLRGDTGDYGQAFAGGFLAFIILNVAVATVALATIVLRTSVPPWFHDKALFAFPLFCAVHLGMGTVFRPHLTGRPLGLLAWAAAVAEGISLVPIGTWMVLVVLAAGHYSI